MQSHVNDEHAPGTAKTWGPFTGRQLTTIICVVSITLLLPVAAWGASASHVIVNGGKVKIDGPIAANVGQRSQFIASGPSLALPESGDPNVLIPPPAGKGLVITTFHATWTGAAANSYLNMFVGNPHTCANGSRYQVWEIPAAVGNLDVPIVPGYVVPPHKVLCANVGGTVDAQVNAYGYVVAAGDAATPRDARP